MMDALPAHYDDLHGSLERAWALVEDGATRRESPCHTPVVATIGDDGAPSARIMVLRHSDRLCRELRFHTDARADKLRELERDNAATVLLYDADAKLQLRLGGMMRAEFQSDTAEEAWQSADRYARRCYLAEPAPGTLVEAPTSGLLAALEGQKPSESQLEPARENFALLLFQIDSIEYLYLAHQGHRRARFQWSDQTWHGQWLVP